MGKGAQQASFNAHLPIAIKQADDDETITTGQFETPVIPESDVPGLLGITSLIANRAVLDFTTLKVHFLGPGEANLEVSPGTQTFQCVFSPSGHMMLPIGEFALAAIQRPTAKPKEIALASMTAPLPHAEGEHE